jgi:phosphorylcholine metabolism protein LicD
MEPECSGLYCEYLSTYLKHYSITKRRNLKTKQGVHVSPRKKKGNIHKIVYKFREQRNKILVTVSDWKTTKTNSAYPLGSSQNQQKFKENGRGFRDTEKFCIYQDWNSYEVTTVWTFINRCRALG